jgi:hypothetical protein
MYASNAARFEQSVCDNLDRLKVCRRKDPKENVFQLLDNWLSNTSNGPWLIVLDNADDARVLLEKSKIGEQAGVATTSTQQTNARLEYLPQCDHGAVLVTSKTREVAKELVYWKDIIAVKPMNEEQALALLCKKLDTWYTEQHAPRLAQGLDFMPLALAQAAAYICQSDGRCSIQQYLVKLKQCDKSEASVLDLDERDLRRDREASNSIMLTWQISFNHIREARPSAAELLPLMSFFDREAIPEALLRETGSGQAWNEDDRGVETPVGMAAVDEKDENRSFVNIEAGASHKDDTGLQAEKAERFEKDVVMLRSYYFISQPADTTFFDMHRLVQLATKKWLKGNSQLEYWGSQFICNLDKGFPTVDFENWEICHLLFPHAVVAIDIEVTSRRAVLWQASLLLHSGQYASETGAYANAERMEGRSLESRKRVLGEGHPDTLTSMNNLAGTYMRQGRWDEAEKLQVEVMKKSKEALREGHPSTLMSMGNLAFTLRTIGRCQSALDLMSICIDKSPDALGVDHPHTRAFWRLKTQWEEEDVLLAGGSVFGLSLILAGMVVIVAMLLRQYVDW